jgi:hypothetical protein
MYPFPLWGSIYRIALDSIFTFLKCKSDFVCQLFQLKLEIAKRGDSSKNEVAVLPPGTDTIDELKRAFELIEVSSPGIAEQLMSRIFVRLQHR